MTELRLSIFSQNMLPNDFVIQPSGWWGLITRINERKSRNLYNVSVLKMRIKEFYFETNRLK